MSRPPKPTAAHRIVGTYRRDRHEGPALTPGKPPPAPAWLSDVAKPKWGETATLLAGTGLLTDLDHDALAAYCETWATWRKAVETVEREGATYRTAAGLVKRHPAVAIAAQAGKDLLAWAERLGLTPAARQRMRVELPSEGEHDPMEDFFLDRGIVG